MQYVDEPLGYFTVKNTAIAEYISPNAASLIVSKGIHQFGLIRPPQLSSLTVIILCDGNAYHSNRKRPHIYLINKDSSQGVGVALVSARLMANPEIKYRHLGVLLFKVVPLTTF